MSSCTLYAFVESIENSQDIKFSKVNEYIRKIERVDKKLKDLNLPKRLNSSSYPSDMG